MGFVQAVTATSTLPHRNRWCTFYAFGNDVVKNQECVSDAGVAIRRWEAGTGWTNWQTIVTRAASFLNKFNTNIVSTGNADNTVDIKMNNWGGYISYNVLLFSRFGIHAIFIQISGNQTIEILTYKTLVGSETLTLTADNTNHLVTVKSSSSWNAFGLLGFCSNVANTYDGTVVLQNMRST